MAKVSDAVYNSAWWCHPRKDVRQSVLLMIQGGQQDIFFAVFNGLIQINLPSFIMVITDYYYNIILEYYINHYSNVVENCFFLHNSLFISNINFCRFLEKKYKRGFWFYLINANYKKLRIYMAKYSEIRKFYRFDFNNRPFTIKLDIDNPFFSLFYSLYYNVLNYFFP